MRAMLIAVLLACLPTLHAESIVFPDDAGIIDLSKEPYLLKGDGTMDCAPAFQKAIDDWKGKNATLYLPNGTYLVADQLYVGGKAHSPDRFLTFQGQSERGTVIRLKDSCPGFTDPAKPKTVLNLYEGAHTNDCMHGYVRNLTVDVGAGNPGAIGIDFIANNRGTVENVRIRAAAGSGHKGLAMDRHWPGPALVKRVGAVAEPFPGLEYLLSLRPIETHLVFVAKT